MNPQIRLSKTSHGQFDASMRSRFANMSRFAGEQDPITLENPHEMIMPLAYRGLNGTIKGPFYDALSLAQWLERNETMPTNREQARTALLKLVAVNWENDGAQGFRPPPTYNWRNTVRFLQTLRDQYCRTDAPQVDAQPEPMQEDPQRQKYISFRIDMSVWVNRDESPEWMNFYWAFHPFDEEIDPRYGIQGPRRVLLHPPANMTVHTFRQEMALRLDGYAVRNHDFDGLIRDYWMVHHIDLNLDDEVTQGRYFQYMHRNIQIFVFPPFFQALYERQRTDYAQRHPGN